MQCEYCGGKGKLTCDACSGTGTTTINGQNTPCESCNGKGHTTCLYCSGSGKKSPQLANVPQKCEYCGSTWFSDGKCLECGMPVLE